MKSLMTPVGPDFASGPRTPKAVRTRVPVLRVCALLLASVVGAPAAEWLPVRWRGEAAYELATADWRAIVSVERARLVHFGPAHSETSLVFAPATRDEPIGWGGHRVWLGPQLTWSSVWPPPDAWEKSAAEKTGVNGSRLELTVAAAGEGWPRLGRIYELAEGKLACRVTVAAGGEKNFQVIQIFQTPPPSSLTVPVHPDDTHPRGFVLLPPMGGRREAVATFPLPAQVEEIGTGTVRLLQRDTAEKVGFPPQEIAAEFGAAWLHVGREPVGGDVVATPDLGCYTQVYVGEKSTPVIELEQLSPLFRAGAAAEFTTLLSTTGN